MASPDRSNGGKENVTVIYVCDVAASYLASKFRSWSKSPQIKLLQENSKLKQQKGGEIKARIRAKNTYLFMDRSTAETWEDMVEAPGLDGITLDLLGGGGVP